LNAVQSVCFLPSPLRSCLSSFALLSRHHDVWLLALVVFGPSSGGSKVRGFLGSPPFVPSSYVDSGPWIAGRPWSSRCRPTIRLVCAGGCDPASRYDFPLPGSGASPVLQW
jgi:hypothetical protein